jgi:hypothetical protein
MIEHIISVLQKFAKNWVFNYEDDITFELRMKQEIEQLKKENNV